MKHTLLVPVMASTLVLCLGCGPGRPPATAPGSYFGPTQTMSEVAAEIDANNAGLATIWARHYFEANIVDERRQNTFANGEGVLLYTAPRGMRLVGEKPGAGRLFEIGSTEDRYWLTLDAPNQPSRMWWGWYRNFGKPCVDTSQVPIRPDLVVEVLGVGTVGTNFNQPPIPTMRFNNEARQYMFVWTVPLGDRWAAQKEIWYDLETKLPSRVYLFDAHGRVVVRARLAGHAPVELPGTPPQRWPRLARRYELFFPDSGSTMSFDLDEVAPERRGVPTRRGISFPDKPNVDEVIQLDRDCLD